MNFDSIDSWNRGFKSVLSLYHRQKLESIFLVLFSKRSKHGSKFFYAPSNFAPRTLLFVIIRIRKAWKHCHNRKHRAQRGVFGRLHQDLNFWTFVTSGPGNPGVRTQQSRRGSGRWQLTERIGTVTTRKNGVCQGQSIHTQFFDQRDLIGR